MTHITYRVVTSEETGGLSLLHPKFDFDGSYSDVSDGYILAHDLLDHQNGISGIGSIADEMQAFGGMWFSRGQRGQTRKDDLHTPHANMASDFMSMAMLHQQGVPIRSTQSKSKLVDFEQDIQDIIDLGVEQLKSEMSYGDVPLDFSKLKQYCKEWAINMRAGYWKAKRRFKDNINFANSLFWQIADAVDRNLPEFEGQEFRLSYDRNNVTFEEVYSYEY